MSTQFEHDEMVYAILSTRISNSELRQMSFRKWVLVPIVSWGSYDEKEAIG